MEKHLYYFKDTYAKGTDDCSFLVYILVETLQLTDHSKTWWVKK